MTYFTIVHFTTGQQVLGCVNLFGLVIVFWWDVVCFCKDVFYNTFVREIFYLICN